MKNPLLTQFFSLVRDRGLKSLSAAIILMVLSVNVSLAQPLQFQTECICNDISDANADGRFRDIITITGTPGQTWTLVNPIGMYSISSPAPPASPIALGTMVNIPEIADGVYQIEFIRLSGQMWFGSAMNGNSTFSLSSRAPCVNPRIFGDSQVCAGEVEVYSLSTVASSQVYTNLVWSTTGGGIIESGQGTPFASINWGNATGPRTVTVTGELGNTPPPGFFEPCDFTRTFDVSVNTPASAPVLACNNRVNLSMNPSCELFFTADQFLEGEQLPDDAYQIIIRDIQSDTIIPNGTLGYKYINKTLEVKIVYECSGNSCWSYAKIEDKSIPDLICPEDVNVECTDVDNLVITGFPEMPLDTVIRKVPGKINTWTVQNYDRCSTVNLSYTDTKQSDLCPPNPYSAIIKRTWLVVDNSGNSSSCMQTINVIRAELEDIDFPPNYDGNQNSMTQSLEACGNWKKIPYVYNGVEQLNDSVPSPEFTGTPEGIICLKATVFHVDRKIRICEASMKITYKLIRKWTVLEHCTGDTITHTQLITVMDTQNPSVINFHGTSDSTLDTVSTVLNTCVGTWTIKPLLPANIIDCSATTVDVNFLLPDANGQFPVNGNYVKVFGSTRIMGSNIINLPGGRVKIRYTIRDECGNFTQIFREIFIKDRQLPTPVCDRNSIISLGSNGTANAGVLTFDDGSHDNCELACMKVRRMDNAGNWNTLLCNNQIKFTCNDLNASFDINGNGRFESNERGYVQVELGVWDKAGLFNSCMVIAKVQDNIFPVFTKLNDMNANCNENFTNLTRFGIAKVTDNCPDVKIDSSRVDALNECGIGTITRFYTATDNYGNVTRDTQVINVQNTNPIESNDIDWGPSTIPVNNKCTNKLSPEDLGIPRPKLKSTALNKCSQMAYQFEDTEFNFGDGFCKKILRKWTAIDWCQKNPFFPERGVFTFTQLIMVNNTVKPVVSKGCNPSDLEIIPEGNCQSRVKVTAQATEIAQNDCISKVLVWSYDIDLNSDIDNITEIKNMSGQSIDRLFEYGTHTITWYVKDDCNNVGKCENEFTLKDNKKPTPYCISELVTVIMPLNKFVDIWASDFDRGATDNCSTGSQITASFHPTDKTKISQRFTCDSLAGATSKDFTLKVYAIDNAIPSNSDYCTVTLRIQDNDTPCRLEPNQKVSLKGSTYNESDEMVQNVNIELKSDQTEFPKSITTADDGKFSFGNLPMNKEYTLSADKNDDPLNGVSTLDLVMIQRHILGLVELDSPYKLIAADVNNSEKITAADLVELRKVILGIQTEFTKNRSWRFVDVAHRFIDPKHPFPFIDYVHLSNLDYDVAGIDFIAVKIGDVNGSSKTNVHSNNVVSNRSAITLVTENVTGKAGEIVNVSLSTEEISNLIGMQMTLSIDNQMVELIEIKSDAISLKDEHLGFSHLSNGLVHLSWNQENAVNISNQMITAKFKLLRDVSDKPLIALERSMISPEIYTKEGNGISVNHIKLESGNRDNNPDIKFELYQNVPNPFNATTIIGFNLPASDEVTLKIFDVTGKMVYQNKGQFSKGYNTFNIDANALNLNGVMYYQIDTETDSATRKMIVIK